MISWFLFTIIPPPPQRDTLNTTQPFTGQEVSVNAGQVVPRQIHPWNWLGFQLRTGAGINQPTHMTHMDRYVALVRVTGAETWKMPVFFAPLRFEGWDEKHSRTAVFVTCCEDIYIYISVWYRRYVWIIMCTHLNQWIQIKTTSVYTYIHRTLGKIPIVWTWSE